ncbi:MAG TPA: molybdopterin-dependent oxidoreductase [Geobacteraceae bacterium]
MVSLTIDGRNISVAPGTTILEAARQLGITIPTLCWLEKVSPTGACRVCAVEVAGVDRPMTACNTPVKEGIVVTTQSEQLTASRKKIMELMLVNHPLDCPVCDAGGECDLQNACYGLEVAKQEYGANLERRPIRYDWTLLESDPNRCILCEKCVKVDHEIVGCDAIAVVNKGEATIIDTIDGKPLNCEFCGNCIAACPTGTLISKPFKFRGRPWAFQVTKSVCAFCSTGCQIEYHSRDGRVERVTSDDATYNEGNLCINGRFGYPYLTDEDRLTTPLVRNADGNLVDSNWETALQTAVERINAIVTYGGANAMAGIGSPRVTNEENFLFQKFLRNAIGTSNIDSEARLGYAPAQEILRTRLGLTGASATIDRIDQAEAVLIIGSDLNAESTGVSYRVIKAATKNDATLVLANLRSTKLSKFANSHLQYRPGGEVALLTGLMKAMVAAGLENRSFIEGRTSGFAALAESLATLSLVDLAAAAGVSETDLQEAARLLAGRKLALIFGADIMRCADAAAAVNAIADLALLTGCLGNDAGGLFPIDEKNNTQGLLDMGVAPGHLPGYLPVATTGRDFWGIIQGIEEGKIKGLYLMGSNPLVSFPNNGRIRKALASLELLLVQDLYATETTQLAHVVLPAAAGAEKSGTFTTPDNRVQCLTKAVNPPGSAREDWVIISELYARLTNGHLKSSPAALLDEIKALPTGYAGTCSLQEGRCSGTVKAAYQLPATPLAFAPVASPSAAAADSTTLVVGSLLFHNGTMSTRSSNNLAVADRGEIQLSAADAARLGISDGATIKVTAANGSVSGPAVVTDRLPAGIVFAPNHFAGLNAAALLPENANRVAVTVARA